MKYCVLIVDGAAGHPLAKYGGKTCLELAQTPNLDQLAKEGRVGMTCNVPDGMEPSSAIACMSIMGYDPAVYYKGRSAIEALSMGIDIGEDEIVLRCNLVAVKDGKMWDYSAGHITTGEAKELIESLDRKLGDTNVRFYPGVSYRHILKLRGRLELLEAVCTPPHDIPGRPIETFLCKGKGSAFLRDLMRRSEVVLKDHPVNAARTHRGEVPATTIWLFWPSGQVPALPSFRERYGVNAAMISGVDLLRGIAQMARIKVVKVPGVTDGLDNDYAAQAEGTLGTLKENDLVVVHVEAPDEAGHGGLVQEKVKAIEQTDNHIISRLREAKSGRLRILILPDHPTPIDIQTHTAEPVPFLFWGPGFESNGARRLTEAEAKSSGFRVEAGYDIMKMLIET